MDVGSETFKRALAAVAQNRELRIEFESAEKAGSFKRLMLVARARNAREVKKLFPELADPRSEWDGLEVLQEGAKLIVRAVKLPKMTEVEL